MSVKMYNGYKLPKMSLTQLMKFTDSLGKQVLRIRKDLVYRETLRSAARFRDMYDLGVRSLPKRAKAFVDKGCINPLYYCEHRLEEEMEKARNSSTRSVHDYDFRVCFIPRQRKILALTYTERREYIEMWEKQPGVEDYHYQTSTDRPPDIAAREWRQRYRDWEQVLLAPCPAYVGLTYNPIPLYYPESIFFSLEKSMRYLPTLSKRVNAISEDLLFKEFMGDKKIEATKIYSLLIEFNTWKKQETNQATVEATVKRVREGIKPVLGPKDLNCQLDASTIEFTAEEPLA